MSASEKVSEILDRVAAWRWRSSHSRFQRAYSCALRGSGSRSQSTGASAAAVAAAAAKNGRRKQQKAPRQKSSHTPKMAPSASSQLLVADSVFCGSVGSTTGACGGAGASPGGNGGRGGSDGGDGGEDGDGGG